MSFRFKQVWLFKYNYIFIIVITVAVVYFMGHFLYNNFYKTITQTDAIALLKTEVALEVADVELFAKIKTVNENKKAGTPILLTSPRSKWLNLNNPFISY